MAITWSDSSDTHRLANVSLGTVTKYLGRWQLAASTGIINGIVANNDIQAVFFAKDDDKTYSFTVSAVQAEAYVSGTYYNEFPPFLDSANDDQWYTYPLGVADPKTVFMHYYYASTPSLPAGNYSLYWYAAYMWVEKDPAQIIFAMASFYSQLFAGSSLKAFLDQSAFEAASLAYDKNPCRLTVVREVGSSIAEQIKKIVNHTCDFLVIRPDSTGIPKLALNYRRGGLTERTTAIDLESESISSYTLRPTDRNTLSRVISSYGKTILQRKSYYPGPGLDDGQSNVSPPFDYPGEYVAEVVQKVGAEDDRSEVRIDCDYSMYRTDVLGNIDPIFWQDDQDEIELAFADWTHFNFQAGDIVHVVGRGLDGTENFLVVEKEVDNDTLLATCRLLEIRGIAGTNPRAIPSAMTQRLLSIRPNSLGVFYDAEKTYPLQVMAKEEPRNGDRWWDESEFYCHPKEFLRGTPPGLPTVDYDKCNGWPAIIMSSGLKGLEFADSPTAGFNIPDSGFASNMMLYVVANILAIPGALAWAPFFHANGTNEILFGLYNGSVAFYTDADGWQGSTAATTGWQILTFRLRPSESVIRRNGVTLEDHTTLTYTNRRIYNTADFAIGCASNGTGSNLQAELAEMHLYADNHTDAEIAAVEAHLSEKYAITI